MRATLELSGITGLRYIEIDRRTGDALDQAPTLSFKPPYEVIPSSRSSFKAIQAALEDVYNRIMQVDFGGISNDARSALQAANSLLRDERIDALLTNFKALSQSTNQLAKNLETMTDGVKLAPAVDNATKASAEARALLTELRNSAPGTHLDATLEQLDRVAASRPASAHQLAIHHRATRSQCHQPAESDRAGAQPAVAPAVLGTAHRAHGPRRRQAVSGHRRSLALLPALPSDTRSASRRRDTRRMNSRATKSAKSPYGDSPPPNTSRWRGGAPAQAGLVPFVARGFNRRVPETASSHAPLHGATACCAALGTAHAGPAGGLCAPEPAGIAGPRLPARLPTAGPRRRTAARDLACRAVRGGRGL